MPRWMAALLLMGLIAVPGVGEDPDPKLIIGELNSLAMEPDSSARGRVIAWLDHEDAGVRRAAIRALGYMGDPGALKDLERFAGDPDPGSRVAYLFAVMRLGNAEIMTAHAAMAQDSESLVRLAAEAGLSRFGIADRSGTLREALTGRDLGRMGIAASGLVLVGGRDNLEDVLGLLNHSMDEVRSLGAQALGDAPPGETLLAGLLKAFNRETYSYVSAALQRSIVRMGSKDPALLARLLPSAKYKEPLIAALKGRPSAALECALIDLLEQPGMEVLPVLEVLRYFDTDAATAAMRRKAFDPTQPPAVRSSAIRWLGDGKDLESRDPLRKSLQDPSPVVRAEACYALSLLNDRASAPRAVALLNDPDPAVVRAALAALRNFRYLPARERIGEMTRHEDPEIRRIAGDALEAIGAKEARMKQEIYRLGHDCILVQARGMNIYFDPFRLPDGAPKADAILVTHDHFDHLSPEDIRKIASDETDLVLPATFKEKASGLPGRTVFIAPGESATVGGLEVRAVPAYNPGKQYHPKNYGGVGYFVRIGKTTYYHAGDTDLIPEMKNFPPADVCFLPVSGTYVMTAAEAAKAAGILKCGKAVPMHYGAIIGGDEDAREFQRLAPCPVEILPLTTSLP